VLAELVSLGRDLVALGCEALELRALSAARPGLGRGIV
jgi:hypothetical protein